MEVILHLGVHRTGTTTFQKYLEGNRDNLDEIATEFWGPNRTRSGLFLGLMKRPRDVDNLAKERGDLSCDLIRLEMDRLAMAQVKFLVVSEENMIGVMGHNLSQASLYPDAKLRLERFSNAFADRCKLIVLSIRAYEDYWASVLAYTVKRGAALPDQAMLDDLAAQPRGWRDLIVDIAAAFPDANLLIWPFEGFAGQVDHQLAMITGGAVPARMRRGRQRHNASPDNDKLRHILSKRGDIDHANLLSDSQARWQPFDNAQVAAFQARYKKDIAWLRGGADGLAMFADQPNGGPVRNDAQSADDKSRGKE